MRKLKDLPLKYQLIIIIFSVSIASLWVTSISFVLYDRHAYKEKMGHELTVIARIIAEQSAPNVQSGNHAQVSRSLQSLAVKRDIVSACVTDMQGNMLATFKRGEHWAGGDDGDCLSRQEFISRFDGAHLDLIQPILIKDSIKIGELHIRQDLSDLNMRLKVFSVVMLMILVLASLVTIVLSLRIQSLISEPVVHLTQLADQVARRQDYTLRVMRDRNDELGKLTRTFNTMMETIDSQNRELLDAKHNLQSQVEIRTAELININKELESFIYSVSHDLRSPLRSIDGFSVALLEDCGSHLDATGKDYLARIRSASQRMGQFIDSLLYLSRVSRQEITIQPVNLTVVADEVADYLKQNFPEHPVTFVRPGTLLAYGDKALLTVVLENLLGNAWKYTAKTPGPRVELGSVERQGVPVYFVRDNGAGFDMKYADKLFGPFQRLHRAEEFDGLGIGLATVARIIHRHSGEIWAEGMTGVGATVYFTLGTHP